MKKIVFSFLIFISILVQAESDSFTQKDREILIRLSTTVELYNSRFEQIDKRFEQIDKRFEQIDKRFEQIENRFQHLENRDDTHFMIIISLFVGLFGIMIGFIFWDRRMALVPVNTKIAEMEKVLTITTEENTKLKHILKEFADKNIDFKDIFSRASIL